MKVNTELAKKLLKTKYMVNGDGGIRTQNTIRLNDIAFLMESYHQQQLALCGVGKRWLFWFEDEGKNGFSFEVEAKDSNDAYDKAYDSYGPQVAGMMYEEQLAKPDTDQQHKLLKDYDKWDEENCYKLRMCSLDQRISEFLIKNNKQ